MPLDSSKKEGHLYRWHEGEGAEEDDGREVPFLGMHKPAQITVCQLVLQSSVLAVSAFN